MKNGSSHSGTSDTSNARKGIVFLDAVPTIRPPELIVDLRHLPDGSGFDFASSRQRPISSIISGDSLKIDPLAKSVRQIEALHVLSNGLSHDLNNLFQVATSALSLIELRAKLGREADIPELVEKAEVALDRAKAVVQRLMLLPVHPTGDTELVDVNAAIRGLHGLLQLLAGSGIEIAVDLTPAQPMIACDVLDLENALLNLVANAKNASGDSGLVTITTAVEPRLVGIGDAGHRARVIITVSDTGHGMTEDVAERAFDPFYSTRADSGGTGLGLAMVRRFLVDAGGSSNIETTVGRGTTISLFLPLAQSDSAASN